MKKLLDFQELFSFVNISILELFVKQKYGMVDVYVRR